MNFKYTIEELDEFIKKVDVENNKKLTCIEMQTIMQNMAKDFNVIAKNKQLSKDNLKLYGIKHLMQNNYLIDEYLFVEQTKNVINALQKLKFIDESFGVAHHYYKPTNKIIISFYTKYHSVICKIVKSLKENEYSLLLIQKNDENGKLVNNKISYTFSNFEELKQKLQKIAEIDIGDFWCLFE